MLRRVGSVKQDLSVLEKFSSMCEDLGTLEGEYTTKLQDNVKPFTVTTPQRVPIPLLEPVRKELDHMEKMGVISSIHEPTDWCAGMVPVQKKKNGEVCICVDLTRLNESVKGDLHPLLIVEQVLALLA